VDPNQSNAPAEAVDPTAIAEADLDGHPPLVLPTRDVFETFAAVNDPVMTTILDPWYNRGVGGVRYDYHEWLNSVVSEAAGLSQHVFVWGFPEIVCHVLDSLPEGFELTAWLTWYYKNCPSVIRGWRSAQLTCLHLSRQGATLYPEHFLNEVQLEKQKLGKLRYMPGPPSVIEVPLNIGFVGRKEQTGHPAQKPLKVIEPLVLMTTKKGDLVLDPMCGAGTTGVVCQRLGRRAVLSDESPRWVEVTRRRLLEDRQKTRLG
jgi:site-specific DNA-methyltransferase (adenine-specific)